MSEIVVPIVPDNFTLEDALLQVCKLSNGNNRLVKGARQVSKRLLAEACQLVLLSEEMDDRTKSIITSLCKQTNTPLINIGSHKELGKYAGFVKLDLDENEKVSKCGCAAITDYVMETEGKVFLMNLMRDMAKK